MEAFEGKLDISLVTAGLSFGSWLLKFHHKTLSTKLMVSTAFSNKNCALLQSFGEDQSD